MTDDSHMMNSVIGVACVFISRPDEEAVVADIPVLSFVVRFVHRIT